MQEMLTGAIITATFFIACELLLLLFTTCTFVCGWNNVRRIQFKIKVERWLLFEMRARACVLVCIVMCVCVCVCARARCMTHLSKLSTYEP